MPTSTALAAPMSSRSPVSIARSRRPIGCVASLPSQVWPSSMTSSTSSDSPILSAGCWGASELDGRLAIDGYASISAPDCQEQHAQQEAQSPDNGKRRHLAYPSRDADGDLQCALYRRRASAASAADDYKKPYITCHQTASRIRDQNPPRARRTRGHALSILRRNLQRSEEHLWPLRRGSQPLVPHAPGPQDFRGPETGVSKGEKRRGLRQGPGRPVRL